MRHLLFSSSKPLTLILGVQILFSSSYLEAFPTTPSRRPSAPRGLSTEVQASGSAAAACSFPSMSPDSPDEVMRSVYKMGGQATGP